MSYIGGGEDYESGPRQFELQVTASAGEKRARARVVVRLVDVPEAPLLEDDSAETLEDTPTVVDVLSNDRDPEGDRLRVVAVGPAEHGTAAVVSGGVRYLPDLNWYGTDRFSYTVAEPEGLTATATVTMTVLPVNDAPEAVGVIPDQALEEGGPTVTVDLTPYFFDVDGDVLTYTAESSDETAVTATVVDSTLTLSAVVTGTATVTVTAGDPEGLTATQAFGVRVGDRPVRAVLTDTLAALGRGHLSSVRSTIGRHLETGGGRTRLTVGGQFLSPDARDLMGAGGVEQSHELLFRAAQLRQRSSPTGMVGTSAHPPARAGMAGLMEPGPGGGWDRFLQGTDVLLSFGGQDEPAAAAARSSWWSVWSQGDLQSFRGAEAESQGYRGDLRTWYLGLDARLGENWLFGSAVARSDGGGDWQVGSSSGRLTTALTVVHPYARWTGRDTSVWALAGIGMGTAQNVRRLQPGRQGTSPLSLGLGLLEGRRRLATTSLGMAVDLQGEASWARLRTGDGTETVDGLDAGVRRVRTGVEVTLSLGPSGGVQVTPFGAVSTRHDGGAGQTGAGLEVAGGGRLSAGRVRVEAQARMLALHTAADYGEKGFSVTATVGAGRHEPGLAVSLRPRWGAPGHGAESLWQDQFRTYTYGHGRDDRAVDAQLSYGLRLSGGRLLVPFGGYSHTVVAGRRVHVGANLQPLGCVGGNPCGPLQVELLGESYSSPRRGTDHRVALFAILSLRG